MIIREKKAFTLVEVLVVIVILGILSTIGIVTLTNIRKNQEKKFDQTQYELFRETAKTYFSDNKSQLPTIPGDTKVIYLGDLIGENYLDSLLDYHKNSYSSDSYVTVIKLGENLYSYTVELKKEGSNNPIETSDNASTINFSKYYKKSKKELLFDSNEDNNTKIYYTNETLKIDLEISDSDSIMAFCYIIYKNNVKIYNSEYIIVGQQTAKDTLSLDLNNHEDGTYQIEVVVYDGKDHKKSKKSDKIMIDRISPSCTRTKSPNVQWTNKATTITGTCADNQGKKNGNSGCKTRAVSQLLNDEGIYNKSPGIVEDKAGNKTKCDQITVKIDKTKPTCTTSGESTTWTNKNRKLIFECTDNKGKYNSGCKVEKVTKTFSDTVKTQNLTGDNAIKIIDNAGNEKTCKSAYHTNNDGNPTATFDIYVDKDKPTKPTITGGSSSWKNYAQIIWTTTKSTSLSGINRYQYCASKSKTTTECSWHNLFRNNGKVTSSDLDVAYYHTKYSDLIKAFSGNVKQLNNHYNTSGKKEGRKSSDSNWLRTSQSFTKEGSYYIYFRAVNNAGTAGIVSNPQQLKIDYTAPSSPEISNNSGGTLTCGTVKIDASSTDSLSGIKSIEYSYDKSTWYTDWNSNNTTIVSGTWSAKRNNTVYIRACDNAKNCSNSSTTTVHIGTYSESSVCGGCTTTSKTCYEYKVITPSCPSGWTATDYNKCGINDASGTVCCKHSYSCNSTTTCNTCCHD